MIPCHGAVTVAAIVFLVMPHFEPTTELPNLAEIRTVAGYESQRSLARDAGTSHNIVWKAEHGHRVALPKAVRLALTLGCSLDDLRGG